MAKVVECLTKYVGIFHSEKSVLPTDDEAKIIAVHCHADQVSERVGILSGPADANPQKSHETQYGCVQQGSAQPRFQVLCLGTRLGSVFQHRESWVRIPLSPLPEFGAMVIRVATAVKKTFYYKFKGAILPTF